MDIMKIQILSSALFVIKIVKRVLEELRMIVRVVKIPIIEPYKILNVIVKVVTTTITHHWLHA